MRAASENRARSRRGWYKGGNDFPRAIQSLSLDENLTVIFIRNGFLRPCRGRGLRGEVFEMEVRGVGGGYAAGSECVGFAHSKCLFNILIPHFAGFAQTLAVA